MMSGRSLFNGKMKINETIFRRNTMLCVENSKFRSAIDNNIQRKWMKSVEAYKNQIVLK